MKYSNNSWQNELHNYSMNFFFVVQIKTTEGYGWKHALFQGIFYK